MSVMTGGDFVELAERRYDVDWDALRSAVGEVVRPTGGLPAALMDPQQAPSYWCVPVLVGDYCGAPRAAIVADLQRYAAACLVRHFHYEPGSPVAPDDDLAAIIADGYAAGRRRAGGFADLFAAKCQSWTVVLTYGTQHVARAAARPADFTAALAAIVAVYSCTQLLDDWHDRDDDRSRGHWNGWVDEPLGVTLRAVDALLRDGARVLRRLRGHPLRDALAAQLRDTAAELADVVALISAKAAVPATPVESGVRFLVGRLGSEATGLWTDFRSSGVSVGSTECISAFIATVVAPIPSGRAAARAVTSHLLVHNRPSGGWGYRADVVEDADSTAWVLLSAMATGIAAAPEVIRRSQSYLLDHRLPDGGFGTYTGDERRQLTIPDLPGWSQSDPSVTCSALLALHATGWRDELATRAACDLVAERCTEAGCPSLWWQGTAYGSWLAVWTLTELGGNRYRTTCDRVRKHLLSTLRADGGSAATNGFDTALAVLTLKRLARPEDTAVLPEWAGALTTLQLGTGGWPGGARMLAPGAEPLGLVLRDELVTTACAVAALHGIGSQPR